MPTTTAALRRGAAGRAARAGRRRAAGRLRGDGGLVRRQARDAEPGRRRGRAAPRARLRGGRRPRARAQLLEARLGAGPGAPPRPLVAQFRRGDRITTAAPEHCARGSSPRAASRAAAPPRVLRDAGRPCATSRRPTTARCRGRAAALQLDARGPCGSSTSRRRRARASARPTRPWRTGRGADAWLVRALRLDAGCADALDFVVDRRLLSADEEAWLRDETAAALENSDRAWVAAVYGARLGCRDADPAGDAARFEAGIGSMIGRQPGGVKGEGGAVLHGARLPGRLRGRAAREGKGPLRLWVRAGLPRFFRRTRREARAVQHGARAGQGLPSKSLFVVRRRLLLLLVKKNDQAQRHFHKACKLAPRFPRRPGSASATPSRRRTRASRPWPRTLDRQSRRFQSAAPLAYIGMEYLRTNNLPLAKHFLRGAKHRRVGPARGERAGRRRDAAGSAGRRVPHVPGGAAVAGAPAGRAPLRRACAASVFNLAQCYRKRRRFEDAARAFGVALSLEPRRGRARAAGVALHALGGAHVHQRGRVRTTSRWPCGPTTFCSAAALAGLARLSPASTSTTRRCSPSTASRRAN